MEPGNELGEAQALGRLFRAKKRRRCESHGPRSVRRRYCDARYDFRDAAQARSHVGEIKKIHFEGNIPWNEITVVSAKDIPGKNHVALILDDQPFLASEEINHPEEPILLLAHPDKYLLEKARRCVRIEYEKALPIFTIEDHSIAKR